MGSLFDMTGLVAVVTGSTKGIGRAIIEQMIVQGARVIVSSRDRVDCRRVAAELNAAYGKRYVVAQGVVHDIQNAENAAAFASDCETAFGRVDVLVCNAAVMPTGPFDDILTGNIRGNDALCAAFRPIIARQGGGSMILVGSIAGHHAMPDLMAYAVAKAGVAHLARCWAELTLDDNIRVNCVAPGLVRSSSAQRPGGEDNLNRRAATVPLGRAGEPEEIAGVCVFLASRAGGYVTGTTLWVDGGRAFLRTRTGEA